MSPDPQPPLVVPSPAESARFRQRVARLRLGRSTEVAPDELRRAIDDCQADLVIVRYPASEVRMFALLLSIDGYDALYADSLVYWRWNAGPIDPFASRVLLRATDDVDEIGVLVRSIFDDYGNHYMANPRLDPAASLEGYVEWAATSLTVGSTALIGVGPDGRTVGFALVDWTQVPPNIQLAGILPGERRRGWYSELIKATMAEARDHAFGGLQISTQVHNTSVIGAWSRLGWYPAETFTTVHLMRRAFIHGSSAVTGNVGGSASTT